MSRSVWFVEQGRYSDYHVVGVYSTRAAAEEVAKAINSGDGYHGDDATVSERALDPGVREIRSGLNLYRVLMLRGGDVERCEATQVSGYEIEGSCAIWPRSTEPAYQGTDTQDVLVATVWARDDKHAVKIVNEKRAQMIANGEWK